MFNDYKCHESIWCTKCLQSLYIDDGVRLSGILDAPPSLVNATRLGDTMQIEAANYGIARADPWG